MDAPRPAARPAARLRPLLPAAASAALAAGLFAVTVGGTFAYDDLSVVRDDPRVHAVRQWGRLWTRPYNDSIDNLYRPLVSSSYAAQWWLHGDRPWAFHLANVLLHAAAAAGVAELARRATGRAAAAWAAGLLFAALPVHAEAVANVVGRAELACALAVVGSLVLLAGQPLTPGRAAAVLALGAVAVLCKEQGLLAPLLWAGFVALCWRGPVGGQERATARVAAVATTWAWAAYLLVREHFLRFDWDRGLLDRAMQPMVNTHGIDRVLLPVALLGRYAALLVWPAHLSPDYGGDVIGPAAHAGDPFLWIGVGVIVAGAALAIVAWRRRATVPLFCLLAAAACYAPVANLLTLTGAIFAERLIYLPSAFVAVGVGWAAARVPPVPRAVALAVLLVPASVLTVRAAAEWNHPRALFDRALAERPGSIQLHLLVAQYDREAGDQTARAAVLADACRRFPDDWQCWDGRARAAADGGDFPAAEDALRQGIARAFNPGLGGAQAYINEKEAAAGWRPTTRGTGGR